MGFLFIIVNGIANILAILHLQGSSISAYILFCTKKTDLQYRSSSIDYQRRYNCWIGFCGLLC